MNFYVFLNPGLPRGLDFNEVTQTFTSIEGVIRVHNLRIWALSMDKTALSAHLAIRKLNYYYYFFFNLLIYHVWENNTYYFFPQVLE